MGLFIEGLMLKQKKKKSVIYLADLQTGRWVNQLRH